MRKQCLATRRRVHWMWFSLFVGLQVAIAAAKDESQLRKANRQSYQTHEWKEEKNQQCYRRLSDVYHAYLKFHANVIGKYLKANAIVTFGWLVFFVLLCVVVPFSVLQNVTRFIAIAWLLKVVDNVKLMVYLFLYSEYKHNAIWKQPKLLFLQFPTICH